MGTNPTVSLAFFRAPPRHSPPPQAQGCRLLCSTTTWDKACCLGYPLTWLENVGSAIFSSTFSTYLTTGSISQLEVLEWMNILYCHGLRNCPALSAVGAEAIAYSQVCCTSRLLVSTSPICGISSLPLSPSIPVVKVGAGMTHVYIHLCNSSVPVICGLLWSLNWTLVPISVPSVEHAFNVAWSRRLALIASTFKITEFVVTCSTFLLCVDI